MGTHNEMMIIIIIMIIFIILIKTSLFLNVFEILGQVLVVEFHFFEKVSQLVSFDSFFFFFFVFFDENIELILCQNLLRTFLK